MISLSATALDTIPSILSASFFSDASIFSILGFVTGCFATKIVQQSSKGWMEVSNVLIFSASSMISFLSNAMTGREDQYIRNLHPAL